MLGKGTILGLIIGLVIIQNVLGQSFDVEDSRAPEHHTTIEKRRPGSLLMGGKYTLYIFRSCFSDQIKVDLRLKGGALPFNITQRKDSSIVISLTSTASSGEDLRSKNIIFRTPQKLWVVMGHDSAGYKIDFNNDPIAISIIKKSWFIELGEVLDLPGNVFTITIDQGNNSRRFLDSLIALNQIRKTVLDEGYYRCIPGGYIEKIRNRNRALFGFISFYIIDEDENPELMDSLEFILK